MPSADPTPASHAEDVKVLFSVEEIGKRNAELAAAIAAARPERLLVLAVLKGSFVFAADLIRALHAVGLKPEMEFITLSSYGDQRVSGGAVRVVHDVESDVAGRDVLLIDDILESGRTLAFAKDLMAARGARRALTCVLLQKPGKRVAPVEADFVGFTCPDLFVVGYGMDAAHAYRQLPFVGVLSADIEAASN
ncbi:hypoxanthine phosphoribosyltransferase [Hansschlegelia sp.]|uniref:hypoxanthine phosphoribosyltransferase n=1 Tax=Hansschlegelia sp. TaxID=2041892 RepID=UPI002B5BF045|nr:hypoxanthine phosphoribosyltransferase [Hansschlegelia sp.]HVI28742.1 hypoxanthine phosphoribosyltransferase [Hansschlegelia sp.]